MSGGVWTTLAPGESASIPPATLRTFKNRSGVTVRVRNVHRPPAWFEDYIEHICPLTRARGIASAKHPRLPIYLSVLILEYPDTPAPGRARERLGLKALASLRGLLRLRTESWAQRQPPDRLIRRQPRLRRAWTQVRSGSDV